MDTKKCIKCGIEKSIDDFYDAKGKHIKHHKKINTCKKCFCKLTHENIKSKYNEQRERLETYIKNNPSTTKLCSMCLQKLPLTDYIFHASKRDLMSNECRKCRTAKMLERMEYKKEIASSIELPDTKICKLCGIEKSISDFNTHYGNKDLHRNECIECQKNISRKHYDKHKVEWNKEKRDNPEKYRPMRHDSHLKKKFGITRKDFFDMLKKTKRYMCNLWFRKSIMDR